jgi:hypothetical protein
VQFVAQHMSLIGETRTNTTGHYRITYQRRSPLNLVVQASDGVGNVIAVSETIFAAPAQVEIDLTTAKDGVVRAPSQFTTLEATVASGLQGAPLQSLQENKNTHELAFLAKSIRVPFTQMAYPGRIL